MIKNTKIDAEDQLLSKIYLWNKQDCVAGLVVIGYFYHLRVCLVMLNEINMKFINNMK